MIRDDDSITTSIVEDNYTARSISKLRQMFVKYSENCKEHRQDAFRDRRYFDGDQISPEWQRTLDANDMPAVPINLIQDNIMAHIGLVASQQTEIRAFARTQAGVPAADVATKLLRYAIDSSNLEVIFREACPNYFIEGIGAVLVECDNTAVYPQIIDFRDFAYDPDSRRSDFSDAKWMGFSRWLPVDTIAETYPEQYMELNPSGSTVEFYDLDAANGFNKDTENTWLNDSRMIRVIEMYYLEGGQWFNVVWCHKGILDFGPSAYMDDYGRSRCPIIAMSANVMADPNAKNQRYGRVRNLVYPQDDYNARRHAALKYAMAKVIQQVDPQANPVDPETLRAEARKREVIMPPGYQIQSVQISAEQVSFMQMAGEEIQRLSPAAAVTGASLPDDASGRSRQFAAAGGSLPLKPLLSRVQDWRDNMYRAVWYCIAQFWHAEMEVRITSDINAPKYLQINQPIVQEVEQPMVDPQTQQPVIDPYTGGPVMQKVAQVVGVENEVAKMDMDFKITTVEKHDNLESEVWEAIMKLAASTGAAPGTPEFRVLLEWAPMPDKSSVLERYDAQIAKQQQDNAPQLEMQQQFQQMQAQIDLLMSQSKADKDASTAEANAAKAERTRLETAMLADNHNTQQELAEVVKQQFFR